MFRSASQFDKLLDKATSNLNLEPDWPVILQICDLIRQGDVQPKYALGAIKKKMGSSNPHVAMFSLNVLESCVKNCGSLVHNEIGTKMFMEHMRDLIKMTTHEDVRRKILELIQAWAFAFRSNAKYRAVQDTVNIMKAEGYKFPALKESDAMFSADIAPEWADGDCCHRCRVQFSLMQRKHHCRACGQVFCGQCSTKTCTLPKYGIEKEVRVCEACFEKLKHITASTSKDDDLPVEYLMSSLAQESQAPPPRKSDAELKEEEELQLAIALSQSEAEHNTKTARGTSSTSERTKSYSPPPQVSSPLEADPELARYLNRSYWMQRSTDFSNASAPALTTSSVPPKQTIVPEQNGVEESEMEEFATNLQSQVEIFVNRMKSDSSRGRSIANDSSVQTLFMNITTMHSKLLRYIQQQDDRRVYYEGLQDKLVQVKDARAALDALREEHREKLRREAEIAARQRQLQMAQKLHLMRKKKQEYLQYQRQLALQHIQEQEREMQIRQEQQKQQYLMGSQFSTLPYVQTGYDAQARYRVPNQMPPQQTAPPFSHFPPPPGPVVVGQSQLQTDQQGGMMNRPAMIPGGIVPPPHGMMNMAPSSMNQHVLMMGSGSPGPSHLPPQPIHAPLPHIIGSQTLQRQASLGASSSQPNQNQPSMGGSQLLHGQPPQMIQGQLPMITPQMMPGQPPMSAPQMMQHLPPMNALQTMHGQLPMSVPQIKQAQSTLNSPETMQGLSAMNAPHTLLTVPQTVQGLPAMNAPQTMQGPSSANASQTMQGPSAMNAPHTVQGHSSLSVPQTVEGLPAMNTPQTMQGPSSANAFQTMQGPSAMNAPHTMQGHSSLSVPQTVEGLPAMNTPQTMQGPSSANASQTMQGPSSMDASQTIKGQSLMSAPEMMQGHPPMSTPQSSQPELQVHQSFPLEPTLEKEKTAELINLD